MHISGPDRSRVDAFGAGHPYVGGMRSELPAQRLNRRLTGFGESGGGVEPVERGAGGCVDVAVDGAVDGSVDVAVGGVDDPILSRWLPDDAPPHGRGWLAVARADPGRAGALALGAVAVVAVLLTVFTLVRTPAAPVMSAKLPPVQPVPSASVTEASSVAKAAQPFVVSVVGLVTTPGLVTLTPGARVADAVIAAGGALDGADSIGLNMARRLADGEQITVGIAPSPGAPAVLGSSVGGTEAAEGVSGTAAPREPSGTPLDLNTATVEKLDRLPGVGPVTAAAIVAWREKNGAFSSVDQLSEVDGIGPARLERLRPLVRV
jgi:competence protein ComEA